MEIRSKSERGLTVRYSHYEMIVMNELMQIGKDAFVENLNRGDYKDKGKGFLIAANRVSYGYQLLPMGGVKKFQEKFVDDQTHCPLCATRLHAEDRACV
jgi:hypothetical protein